ncbi:hypothetical protein [Halorubrum sp. DTA46]|uniref:hypothetical protein n=1 Tax=Halorubrum sp. DTA46 TaxID=3402162 RepID=UPI003AAECA5C
MAGVAAALVDFGNRSLLTHAIMAVTLTAAIVIGLTVDTQVGLVSFVALLNFTAGMWVCQSIHSLGAAAREDEYTGVIAELRDYGK